MSAFDEFLHFRDHPFDFNDEGPCLLLRTASELIARGQTALLHDGRWEEAISLLGKHILRSPRDQLLLHARLLLIQAATTTESEAALRALIGKAVANYWGAWGGAPHDADTRSMPSPYRTPAWLQTLRADRWGETFRQIARGQPWGLFDPAVSLAGATMAGLLGGFPKPAWTAQTWLLLALQENRKSIGGVVAELTMSRIPDGCGCFYPDPLMAGYVLTGHDFQQALHNAWLTEIQPELKTTIDFDVCWSTRVMRNQLGRLPLEGRSGEAALCCCLRAIRRKDPLDENIAATAQLAAPGETRYLLPVASVLDKLLAPEFSHHLSQRRIFEIVVHTDQQEAGKTFDNGKIKALPAATVDEAYKLLSRWSRMTRDANRSIARTAKRHLRKACAGRYVPSHLSRRKSATLESSELKEQDRYARLTRRERKPLLTGGTSRKRVRVFADSGTGKTVLLQYWERCIATAGKGLLPLRLTNLSSIPWCNEIALLAWLANQMRVHLPDDEPEVLTQWLKTLRDRGRLVFLLDALDQTSDLGPLHAWLAQGGGGVQDCLVVITGRQLVERGDRAAVFEGADWETLRVDLFDEHQQREFLGSELAARLIPDSSGEWWPRTDGEKRAVENRKEIWQPLLKVPLLLRLMRDLARDNQLDAFPNRERLYQRALVGHERTTQCDAVGMIGKGLTTTRGGRFDREVEVEDVVQFLARFAWAAFTQQGFTGQLGEQISKTDLYGTKQVLKTELHQAHEQLPVEDLFGMLTQVNVLTKNSLLDGHEGFAWRHLSFGEFFAGVHLAERLDLDQQTAAIGRVHDVLAAYQQATAPRAERGERSPVQQWEHVFRFALCRAQANRKVEVRDHLARELIAHGNPYVVYDAMRDDGLKLDADLDQLCRWLVHQTRTYEKDYTNARQPGLPPAASLQTLEILQTLFDRRYRNSLCLPPAWVLIQDGLKSASKAVREQAARIRNYFLAEIEIIRDQPPTKELVEEFLASFRSCPPQPPKSGQLVTFEIGASPEDDERASDDKPRHRVSLRPFEMADFPVTNQVYEIFDPSHFWWRGQYSATNDQPVVYVNWFMADLFCQWLSGAALGQYRLPTEAEWEFAARGGKMTRYWWGKEFDASRCNSSNSGIEQTMGRGETTDMYRNDFGLYQMLGNVYHWCADYFRRGWYRQRTGAAESDVVGDPVYRDDGGPSAGSSRVMRGGCFVSDYRLCRSSYRARTHPGDLHIQVGFRVVRSLSGACRPP